jgi:hypothetical protein
MPRPSFHVLVLLALWLVPACRTVPNPDYCNINGDCADRGENWVCNADNACEPPATNMDCENHGECNMAAPYCDPGTMRCRTCSDGTECKLVDEGTPICNIDGQCVAGCGSNMDCDLGSPVCNMTTGVCGPCSGAGLNETCMMREEGADYCSDGACVECTDSMHCDSDAPVCGANKQCGVCEKHSDCDRHSGICGSDGQCISASEVVYVAKSGTDSGACIQGAPCASLPYAIGQVQADTMKRFIRILEVDNYAGPLGGTLTLTGVAVTIVAEGATITSIDSNKPALEIGAGADVTLDGAVLSTTSIGADGVRCTTSGSRITLQKVNILNNRGIGINVSGGCELIADRSLVSGNLDGGIKIVDAAFTITNNYVMGNGSASSPFGGIQILNSDDGITQILAFNTLWNNNASSTADTRGVDCDLPGASALTATGNILRGGTGGVALLKLDNCDWTNSNIEALPPELMDGTNIDDLCGIMIEGSELPRIEADTPCDDSAKPVTGVTVDYFGDLRSPTSPDMGADEIFTE